MGDDGIRLLREAPDRLFRIPSARMNDATSSARTSVEIVASRFVAFPGSSEVERDAGEELGIFRHLKRVTGVIGGQEGDENQRSPAPCCS